MLGLPPEDYQLLLELLNRETLYEDSTIVVAKKTRGWSEDKQKGRIQAALSIALEASSRAQT